jgi:hypothetical protein
MLQYITLYTEEGVEIGAGCDICHVDDSIASLRRWLVEVYPNKLNADGCRPNLCPDHGRELGVAW